MHLTDDTSFPQSNSNGNNHDIGAWLSRGQLALTLIPDEETGMQPYQGLVALEARPRQLLRGLLCALRTTRYRLHFTQYRNTRPLRDRLIAAAAAQSSGRLRSRPRRSSRRLGNANGTDGYVTDTELGELDVQTLLHLFHEYPALQPPKSLSYQCTCNSDRTDSTLMMLGKNDFGILLKEQGEMQSTVSFVDTAMPMMAIAVARLMGQIDELAQAKNEKPLHQRHRRRFRFTPEQATYAQISLIHQTALSGIIAAPKLDFSTKNAMTNNTLIDLSSADRRQAVTPGEEGKFASNGATLSLKLERVPVARQESRFIVDTKPLRPNPSIGVISINPSPQKVFDHLWDRVQVHVGEQETFLSISPCRCRP